MIPADLSGQRKQHLGANLSTRTAESTSSDDVHSLCSQLSNLPKSRNLSAKTVNSLSSETQAFLPKQIDHPYFRRCYTEIALLPTKQATLKECSFEKTQIVQEFEILGDNFTFKKHAERGTNNPWRRYGALAKLHEIGGFAPSSNNKKERKNRDQLLTIKKNTKPPNPPTNNQMTLNRVKKDGKNLEARLHLTVPKNMISEQAAQKMAEQIAAHVLLNGQCLVKEE
ncbi:unnamed protein product [Caenorhabditis angaria]|uniref:Uncharacterized protein n=1 Tax=Caenorhabditis angaria TaxID=860376 RepID=A0A9P1IIQ1_9PELO|nr:unnamed protein product [Caenorhabditis angaria]